MCVQHLGGDGEHPRSECRGARFSTSGDGGHSRCELGSPRGGACASAHRGRVGVQHSSLAPVARLLRYVAK